MIIKRKTEMTVFNIQIKTKNSNTPELFLVSTSVNINHTVFFTIHVDEAQFIFTKEEEFTYITLTTPIFALQVITGYFQITKLKLLMACYFVLRLLN